jgi:hypothetical protein
MFRFCIKELLTHLHRSAAQNIVFCFTNCRSTFYKPGDTLPALRILVAENPDVEIPLGKHTIYCMDNEPFRFLAALKNGMSFSDKDRQDYAISWDRAVEETTRLFKQIQTLKPHTVQDTLSLNDARKLIVDLSVPIAKISENIQVNITVLENRKEEIKSFKGSIEELRKKMYVPSYQLESRELDKPRTVCSSPSCTSLIKDENTGINDMEYHTHCHDNCIVEGIPIKTTNNANLKRCAAFRDIEGNSYETCRKCGCLWSTHMHIDYETFRVLIKKIDENVEIQMKTKEGRKQATEKLIQDSEETIKKLEGEQDIITKASAKFAYFLKENAISAYNDALGSYLEHLIHEEKNKIKAGGGDKTLLGLEQMQNSYNKEVQILERAMNNKGGEQVTITPDDINKLKKELFALEINGKQLQGVMETAQAVRSTVVAYQERPIKTRNNRKSDGFAADLTNAVIDGVDTVWNMFNPKK